VKIILILFTFFLFLNCNKENRKFANKLKINDEWIKDSLGCLGKRNEDYSESMIKKYTLRNSNTSDFKNVFGNPNTIEKDSSNTEILIYFLNSFCENNIPQDDSDKCYARFYFRNNILIDRDYICE